MPVRLDVIEAFAETVVFGQDIALRETEAMVFSILSVGDQWAPDKMREAQCVVSANDILCPAICDQRHKAGKVEIADPMTGIQSLVRYTLEAWRDDDCQPFERQFPRLLPVNGRGVIVGSYGRRKIS